MSGTRHNHVRGPVAAALAGSAVAGVAYYFKEAAAPVVAAFRLGVVIGEHRAQAEGMMGYGQAQAAARRGKPS